MARTAEERGKDETKAAEKKVKKSVSMFEMNKRLSAHLTAKKA